MILKLSRLQQNSDPAADNFELDNVEIDADRYLLERWLRLAEAALRQKADHEGAAATDEAAKQPVN